MTTALAGCGTDCSQQKVTLKVYNWGEYIAPGLLDQFEEATGIHVDYDTYNDNESSGAKVKNGFRLLRRNCPLRLYGKR